MRIENPAEVGPPNSAPPVVERSLGDMISKKNPLEKLRWHRNI